MTTSGSAILGPLPPALMAGANPQGHPAGTKTGDVIHVFKSGSIQMLTDVSIDPAGNVWAANNWNAPEAAASQIRPPPSRLGAAGRASPSSTAWRPRCSRRAWARCAKCKNPSRRAAPVESGAALELMPMELQIIRAQEFIRLGAHGRIDLKASKEILAKLAAACWKRGINQALLDLRALHFGPKPVFSPNDLAVLVNTFREIGFTHRERLAVLYRADPHHRARLFSFIATLHGWNVRAFDSFEEAVAWLSGAEPEQSEVETDLHNQGGERSCAQAQAFEGGFQGQTRPPANHSIQANHRLQARRPSTQDP